jgi:hypothetical protein
MAEILRDAAIDMGHGQRESDREKKPELGKSRKDAKQI